MPSYCISQQYLVTALFPYRFANETEGQSFSLSTDDPGVMQCCISDEYILAEKMGLNEEQLIQSVRFLYELMT